jgi:hypothetical protein
MIERERKREGGRKREREREGENCFLKKKKQENKKKKKTSKRSLSPEHTLIFPPLSSNIPSLEHTHTHLFLAA